MPKRKAIGKEGYETIGKHGVSQLKNLRERFGYTYMEQFRAIDEVSGFQSLIEQEQILFLDVE